MAVLEAVHEFQVRELWLDGAFSAVDGVHEPGADLRLVFPRRSVDPHEKLLAPTTLPSNKYFSHPAITGYTESRTPSRAAEFLSENV